MSYFLENCFHFQWIDFFHFGSNKHGLYPKYMKLCRHKNFRARRTESIHDLDSSKIGFILKMVRAHDFNHPVKHTGSQNSINFMVAQKFSLGLFSFQTILHLLPICTTVFFSDGCLLGWLGKLVLPVRVDLLENGLGADRIGGGN